MKFRNIIVKKRAIIFLIIMIVIIYFLYKLKNFTECFETYNNWTPELINRFRIYQATVNENNHQFNMEQIQRQATPEEAEELLKTGYWHWPDSLIALYLNKIGNNNIVKIDPGVSLNYDMKLYNQKAATELVSWNTKEGEFLLNGVDLGINSNMNYKYFRASLPHDTIKCTTFNDGTTGMQKVEYTGINNWNGYTNKKISNLHNDELPNEIPGFSFVKNVCNPCVALNNPADYSCPFEINVEDNSVNNSTGNNSTGNNSTGNNSTGITYIWKQLWGLV